MTIKDVGYPSGLVIDTDTGLISGVPLPEAIIVDFGNTRLDSSYAGAPVWDPCVQVPRYQGYGTVYAGYHAWDVFTVDGDFTKKAAVYWNPDNGDCSASVQIYLTANPGATSCWVTWPVNAAPPFGTYSDPYSTSGVIGSSTWAATAIASPSRLIDFDVSRWLGFWNFNGGSDASLVTGLPALNQMSPWVGVLAPIVDGHIEITAGTWNERCAAFASPVSHAVAAARVSKTNNVIVRLTNSLNDATTYCIASLDVQSTSGAVKMTVNRHDLGGSDTWDGVVGGGDSVYIALEVRADRRIVAWLNGVMHDTGILWPAGVNIGSVQFVGRNVGGVATLDDCCAFSGPATPALIDVLKSGQVPAADGSMKLPSSAAFNTARWVGAWDVEATGEPNLVAAAPGSAFTLVGFTGYGLGDKVAGGPGASTQCISLPSGASSYQRGASMTQVTLTAFTLSGFLKGDSAGHAPGLRIFQAIDNSAGTVQFAVGTNNLTIGGVSYPVTVEPADAEWHHYALTWDGSTGATRIYIDGVEVWAGTTFIGTVACGWCGFDAATAELNGFGDLFSLHRDVLPPSAISRLAEGKMPDASGRLPDAPLAVEISATNAAGSDVETLMLVGVPLIPSYRYWRVEITDAGSNGTFGGFVVNEIEGFANADGSGTNEFSYAQGTLCTSTGGYNGSPGYTGDSPASAAIDGVTGDSASGTYTALGNTVGQYFQFDLGSPKVIRLAKIFFTSGTWQVGVKLRGSADGTNWSDASDQVIVGVGARPTLLPAL